MMELLVPQESRYRHVFFEGRAAARRIPMVRSRPVVRRRGESPTIVRAEHAEFLQWLLKRAGVNHENYRLATLAKRIPACLRALRVATIFDAHLKIESQSEMLQIAVNAILIGVTEFFRDREVFETLSRQILPRLSDRALIRCWSAGCSDGAEAYSLVILLAEAGLLSRSHVHATDCRSSAIAQAREGVFGPQMARTIPPYLRDKYFVETEQGLQVKKELRDQVSWEVKDIFSMQDRACWDLICCRNLAIYCGSDAVDQLWLGMADALSSGGCLVVGRAESLRRTIGLGRMAPCIYRKIGGER